MAWDDEVYNSHDVLSAPLLFFWKIAERSPKVLVLPVFCSLEQISDNGDGPIRCPHNNANILRGMPRSRDYLNVIVDLIGLPR